MEEPLTVIEYAELVFGDADLSYTWLNTPKDRFKGATPMRMAETDPDAVMEMLVQIREGMFT